MSYEISFFFFNKGVHHCFSVFLVTRVILQKKAQCFLLVVDNFSFKFELYNLEGDSYKGQHASK